jgi:acetylglutamate kinase
VTTAVVSVGWQELSFSPLQVNTIVIGEAPSTGAAVPSMMRKSRFTTSIRITTKNLLKTVRTTTMMIQIKLMMNTSDM